MGLGLARMSLRSSMAGATIGGARVEFKLEIFKSKIDRLAQRGVESAGHAPGCDSCFAD